MTIKFSTAQMEAITLIPTAAIEAYEAGLFTISFMFLRWCFSVDILKG